MQRQIDQTK
uniref:Uncharacterized protein n=1 Tax=Rhizophora mucronata TaxID=61149 RepID=A0A2P2NIA1_RHIMU